MLAERDGGKKSSVYEYCSVSTPSADRPKKLQNKYLRRPSGENTGSARLQGAISVLSFLERQNKQCKSEGRGGGGGIYVPYREEEKTKKRTVFHLIGTRYGISPPPSVKYPVAAVPTAPSEAQQRFSRLTAGEQKLPKFAVPHDARLRPRQQEFVEFFP